MIRRTPLETHLAHGHSDPCHIYVSSFLCPHEHHLISVPFMLWQSDNAMSPFCTLERGRTIGMAVSAMGRSACPDEVVWIIPRLPAYPAELRRSLGQAHRGCRHHRRILMSTCKYPTFFMLDVRVTERSRRVPLQKPNAGRLDVCHG